MPNPRLLSIEEIQALALLFKDDLQRKSNRYVRQDENRDAYAAILGAEYIDQFVQTLKLRAGIQLERPARARPISLKAIQSK